MIFSNANETDSDIFDLITDTQQNKINSQHMKIRELDR